MELTPDLLLEAKFGPSRRGYDMEEVDDFLERVAAALDVLLGRLTTEFTRAESAEADAARLRREVDALRAADNGADNTIVAASAIDDTPTPVAAPAAEINADAPMRILVHAERTAEAVVAEARLEANRLTEDAGSMAAATRAEADTLLEAARAEAEVEARKAGEQARRAIHEEVLALRHDRDSLATDVRQFKRWLDDNRTRVRTTVRDLQRLVDDPNALRDQPLPDGLATTSPRVDDAADGDATMAVEAIDFDDNERADDELIDVSDADTMSVGSDASY